MPSHPIATEDIYKERAGRVVEIQPPSNMQEMFDGVKWQQDALAWHCTPLVVRNAESSIFDQGMDVERDIFVGIGRSVDAAVYVGFSREHCRDGTIGNFQHSPDGCFKDFLAFASVC